MIGDVNSRKSKSRYLMTFIGDNFMKIKVINMCCIIHYRS